MVVIKILFAICKFCQHRKFFLLHHLILCPLLLLKVKKVKSSHKITACYEEFEGLEDKGSMVL